MPRPDWGPTVRMKKGKNNERAIRKCLPIKGEATGLFLWKLSSTILRLCRRQWLKPSQNVPEVLYNKRRIDKPPWQGLLCPTGWGIWLSNPDRGRGLLFSVAHGVLPVECDGEPDMLAAYMYGHFYFVGLVHRHSSLSMEMQLSMVRINRAMRRRALTIVSGESASL